MFKKYWIPTLMVLLIWLCALSEGKLWVNGVCSESSGVLQFVQAAGDSAMIKLSTVDGADTGYLLLSGSGGETQPRGAFLQLMGNEEGLGLGDALLTAGDAATGGRVYITSGDGSIITIERTGALNCGAEYIKTTSRVYLNATDYIYTDGNNLLFSNN